LPILPTGMRVIVKDRREYRQGTVEMQILMQQEEEG
jgi:hypothetical protein